MKTLTLHITLFLFLIGAYAYAQDCDTTKFEKAIVRAAALEEEKKFIEANAQYNAAKVFCQSRKDEVQEKQNALLVRINRSLFLADSLRKVSDSLKVEAELREEAGRILNLAITVEDTFTKLRILEHGLKKLLITNQLSHHIKI